MLDFAGRFSNTELLIKQGKYWSVVFRESTTTLGNCTIICNRQCPSMGELTADEMAEFPCICKWYEDKVKRLYGCDKFNYVAMMMKEEFVHFHVIPRYSKPVEKYGLTWVDEDWPKGTKLNKIEIPNDVKKQIINDLKNN